MKQVFKSDAFIFLLIVLAHMAYKLLYLDKWGFWHDEAFSLYYSQQHWGHIKHISEWDINPPLYYYFLWIWQNLFGIGEYAVRTSSVIFSALSAGLLYLLCTRNFSRLCGFFAVLFFSISSEMYFYAHEARPYSLILLLVLCSSWFFLEMLKNPGWINAVMLGVLNFGLIYTHYVSGIIIGVQVVVILFQKDKRLFKFIGTALGITLLIAVLRFTKKTIALVLHNEKSSFWIEKPGFRDLADTFYSFFNGPDLFYIFLLSAFITVVYLVRARELKNVWTENKGKLLYLLLAGPGSLVFCFCISLFMPLFVRRYLLFAAPFLFMILAYFISLTEKNIRYPLYSIIGLFALFSVMRINFETPRSMDYRHAIYLVKSLQQKDIPVLVETPDVGALFSYYYDRETYKDYGNIDGRLRDRGVYLVANAGDVKTADVTKYDRVILTQTFEEANPADKELIKYLSANFPQRRINKTYAGVTISVFSK